MRRAQFPVPSTFTFCETVVRFEPIADDPAGGSVYSESGTLCGVDGFRDHEGREAHRASGIKPGQSFIQPYPSSK